MSQPKTFRHQGGSRRGSDASSKDFVPDAPSNEATEKTGTHRHTIDTSPKGNAGEKRWTSGDQFHHPMPKFDVAGDSWDRCYDIAKTQDQDMCIRARDEIEKLLFFAGLFSAVVTSFTIQSYQWLQETPENTSTRLLKEISWKLSNPGLQPPANITAPPFVADPWTVRVNILWFLSLTLALTVALVGILCIQWIREFQLDASLMSKSAFALRFMRVQGFVSWQVPAILSSLPLLLQISLVLFFVGIVDFLWNQNRVVAICISIAVGITLAFLLVTTILPALQYLCTTDRLLQVPQCPYKSTQSMIFFQILIWVLKPISYCIFYLDSLGVNKYAMASLYNPPPISTHSRKMNWRTRLGKVISFPHSSRDWRTMDMIWRFWRDAIVIDNVVQPYKSDHVDGLDAITYTTEDGLFHKARCLQNAGLADEELHRLSPALKRWAKSQTVALPGGSELEETTLSSGMASDYLNGIMLGCCPSTAGAGAQDIFDHYIEINVRLLNSGSGLSLEPLPRVFWETNDPLIIPDSTLNEALATFRTLGIRTGDFSFVNWHNGRCLQMFFQTIWNSNPKDCAGKLYLTEMLHTINEFRRLAAADKGKTMNFYFLWGLLQHPGTKGCHDGWETHPNFDAFTALLEEMNRTVDELCRTHKAMKAMIDSVISFVKTAPIGPLQRIRVEPSKLPGTESQLNA